MPGLLVDGEPVHGSRPILARLEQIEPRARRCSPSRSPIGSARQSAGATRSSRTSGARLPWGALHFRPEALGTFGGGGPLDPAGTDFAMRMIRGTWKYHGISCERLAEDLAGLPEKLERIEAFAAEGVIGGEAPNAADLQIGATILVLLASATCARCSPGPRRNGSRYDVPRRLCRRGPRRRLPRRLGA